MRKQGRGEAIKISKLFDAYKTRFKAPESSVIKVFIEVVEDVLNVTLKESWCAYRASGRVLTLTVPGPIKTEIFLHKKEIITHLKGRLGEQSAPKEIL